jgi:hypothetical protein
MSKDFKNPAGKYAGAESGQKGGQPKKDGTPTTGFDNSSHGNLAPKGARQGRPGSGKRIK